MNPAVTVITLSKDELSKVVSEVVQRGFELATRHQGEKIGIEGLAAKLAEARDKEVSAAIQHIRHIAEDYQLTPYEICPDTRKLTRHTAERPTAKVEPKYRDPATGASWTGRGKALKWIAEQDRQKFLIG